MENPHGANNNVKSTRSSKRTGNQLQAKKAQQAKLKELYQSSISSVVAATNKTSNRSSSADTETREPPTPQRITRSVCRANESTPSDSSMSPIKVMPAGSSNDELNNVTPDKANDAADQDKDASSSAASTANSVEDTAEEVAETPSQRLARRKAHPLKDIAEPLPTDCLFGRGGGTNHHPGNKLYRKMVEDKKEKYLHSKRLDKPLVAMEIITAWRELDPPGRFLKQDEVTKLWSDVGDKKAREKTSQALREKTGKTPEEECEKETRFESGTKLQRGNLVARDHSLGTDYVEGGALYSMEGFSWDESDNASHSHRDSGASASSSREYPYVRDHPPAYYGHPPPPPPPPHPSQYHSPYVPPPPHHHAHHPYPPHYSQHHERGRNHSLSGHPLPGASTSKPAQHFDDERRGSWGHRTNYSYDSRVPPPLPPPAYYYGHPPPPPPWGSPPPHGHERSPPPHGHYGRPPPQSAFAPYGDARLQYYDSMSRPAGSPQDFTKIADLMSMEEDETKQDEKMTRGNSTNSNSSNGIDRSNSWGGYERKHSLVARDTSIGTFAPFDALNEDVGGLFDETTIQRSKSMPHPTPGQREASNGSSDDGFPSPPQPIQNRKKPECVEKEASPVEAEVEKPSLMRKISGGGLRNSAIPAPLDGVCRPEPVKRDTSNQPESMETKRSVKRVVLSRDKSAISRHLKEEQSQKFASSKLSKAEMLDRKLSVEINKLGLDERPMSLDRITTDQILNSLLDDDLQNSLLEPQPLTLDDRLDTIGAIANDIYSGHRTQSCEVDDALGLIMEDGDEIEAPSAVNDDIAAKWITGGSFAEDDPKCSEI